MTDNPKDIIKRCIRPEVRPHRYQVDGVAFLHKTGGRGLILDEMGLGKTIEAILWCTLNPDKRPILILCPARLKNNWRDELNKWLNDDVYTYQIIETMKDNLEDVDFVIASYDILPSSAKLKKRERIKLSPIGQEIYDRGFSVLVLDEFHKISGETKRTKSVLKIGKKIPHIIGLSGTPIRNRPINLYNMLKLIDPEEFDNWMWYVNRYCNAQRIYGRLDVLGASNLRELRMKMSKFSIRRLKADVLDQLPPKQYTRITVDLAEDRSYAGAMADLRSSYKADDSQIVQSTKLRMAIGMQKIDAAIDFIDRFYESNPDKKLVVFTHHHAVTDELRARATRMLGTFHGGAPAVNILDGRTSTKQHPIILNNFQTVDKPQVLIVGIQGAVGFNLHAADTALFVEQLYVPADMAQAEDRLHRIGQQNPVSIYTLVANHSLDEYVINVLDRKRAIIGEAIDGGITAEDVLREALQKLFGV